MESKTHGTIRAQVFSRLLGIVDSEVWQESWGYEDSHFCNLFWAWTADSLHVNDMGVDNIKEI